MTSNFYKVCLDILQTIKEFDSNQFNLKVENTLYRCLPYTLNKNTFETHIKTTWLE